MGTRRSDDWAVSVTGPVPSLFVMKNVITAPVEASLQLSGQRGMRNEWQRHLPCRLRLISSLSLRMSSRVLRGAL
jgi:hypothetical protein